MELKVIFNEEKLRDIVKEAIESNYFYEGKVCNKCAYYNISDCSCQRVANLFDKDVYLDGDSLCMLIHDNYTLI